MDERELDGILLRRVTRELAAAESLALRWKALRSPMLGLLNKEINRLRRRKRVLQRSANGGQRG